MPMALLRFRIGASISDAEGREVSPIGTTSAGIVIGSSRRINSAPCSMMRLAILLGSRPWLAKAISNRRPSLSVSALRIS